MAPLRSHIFHLFNTDKTNRKVSYWYGARSKREDFYEDEFRQIIAIPNEGKDPVATPTDRDLGRVNHVGHHMPVVLPRIPGGSFQETVMSVRQG